MNVSFHEDARDEYIAAIEWYERDYPGRGERFRAAIERTLSTIASEPLAFPKRAGAHAAVVHRFPYVVFFEIHDGQRKRPDS